MLNTCKSPWKIHWDFSYKQILINSPLPLFRFHVHFLCKLLYIVTEKNPDVFKPFKCSEPCWTPKMKIFAKIVNYFRKNVHLRFLTGFWIQLWLGKVLRTVLEITDTYSFKDLVTEIHPLERNLSSRLQVKKNI